MEAINSIDPFYVKSITNYILTWILLGGIFIVFLKWKK